MNKTRYLLGHVAATLLILEISRKDAVHSNQETGDENEPLNFRYVSKAIRLIFGTQNLYEQTRALVVAAVYQIAHDAIGACLKVAIFRHELLRPFAYACSSVLLCELHLLWTCATISAYRPQLHAKNTTDQRTWRRLAGPSFMYGICQALMQQVQGLAERSMVPSVDEVQIPTSKRASFEIFVVIIVLSIRILGLVPASVTLILTEASLLPGNLETIIPSPTKQRGSTIAELLGGRKIRPGFGAVSSALHAFGVPQYLWLLELHLKKCLIQLIIELLTLPVIMLGII